jgi:hypothetical protein
MLYNVAFSDDYFQGSPLQVDVEGTFTSIEDFIQVLLTQATTLARERIVATGFDGLVEQWDRRRWHIHDISPEALYDPPETIWICSHC